MSCVFKFSNLPLECPSESVNGPAEQESGQRDEQHVAARAAVPLIWLLAGEVCSILD